MLSRPPSVDEVKIRVLATSVCGTDKSIYRSATSEGIRTEMQRYLANDSYKPIIVGHEFSGIVEELGEGGFQRALEKCARAFNRRKR